MLMSIAWSVAFRWADLVPSNVYVHDAYETQAEAVAAGRELKENVGGSEREKLIVMVGEYRLVSSFEI